MNKKDDDLQRYFDGELDAAERARVEAALTDDDRARLLALGELRALTAGALNAEAADADVWPAVEAGLKKERTRRWRDRARGRRFMGTGAGLLIAAVATLLLIFKPWDPKHVPTNNCDIEMLETDGVQATVLDVPDGHHGGDNHTTILFTMEED
jgi:anti-sigma factor RsiW